MTVFKNGGDWDDYPDRIDEQEAANADEDASDPWAEPTATDDELAKADEDDSTQQ